MLMKQLVSVILIVYWAQCLQAKTLSSPNDPTDKEQIDINKDDDIDDNEKTGRIKLLADLNDPSKIFLKPGASHLLSCSSLVGKNITLLWLKDSIEIKRATDQRNILYTLDYMEQVDNGCYTCMGIFTDVQEDSMSTPQVYKDMKETCITVIKSPILEVNQLYNDVYYETGQEGPIELCCKAYSLLDLSYEWFGDNVQNISEIRTSRLLLFNYDAPYIQTFHCIVSNKVGKVNKWFRLIPKMTLDPPHIISTQIAQNHIIVNVLTKRVPLYGRQLLNYLVNCGGDDSTTRSFPIDKPYIMIPYTPTNSIDYIECSIQVESVSKMLSDKVYLQVAVDKYETIPTGGNIYFKSLSSTGNVTFSYWLSPDIQKNSKKHQSNIYLSIKLRGTKKLEALKLPDYDKNNNTTNNQSEGTVEIDELKLNSNYTINLIERGEFFTDTVLASPITLFMPNDKSFIEKQNIFYPQIREIILKSYESILVRVYFYEENPNFRVTLCDCCLHCYQTHAQIIEKFPNERLVTIYLDKLIPQNDYVIKINHLPSTMHQWLQSYEKHFTMPTKIIPMPRNVLIHMDNSTMNVTFEVSSANHDIRGTIVLIQYSDISMKYYVPITLMKTSIPLRKKYIIFNIGVYHYNSENVGESFTKYVYSETMEKNPKILVYSAMLLIVTGILLIIIIIFIYYACQDPYKKSNFKKLISLSESNNNAHFSQSKPDLLATNLSTQTNINIQEFEFDMHEFNEKLSFLKKSYNHMLIYEFKMFTKLTMNVHNPRKDPPYDPSPFKMRTFKPETQVHYILLNSPKVNEHTQFLTLLQELSPCLVVSLESNNKNSNNYWNAPKNSNNNNNNNSNNNNNNNNNSNNNNNVLEVNIVKSYSGCVHREIKYYNNISHQTYQFNHLEYLDWPVDSSFPSCYGSYAQLQKLILLALINNPQKPVVLHCQNGVDKCGTAVALNYFIKKYNNTDEINIIKNLAEYSNWNNFYLISDWRHLMNVYYGCYELLAYTHLTLKVDNYNRPLIATEYEDTFSHLKDTFTKKIAKKFSNYSHNNNKAYIPFDKNIPLIIENTLSLYINASWIRNNNFHINDYIITQNPQRKTMNTFFSMIYQNNCSLIINANNLALFDSLFPIPSNYIPIDDDIAIGSFRNHVVNAITPNINCQMKFSTLRQYNCTLSNSQQENNPPKNLTIISIHTTPNQVTPQDDISAICKFILRIIDARKKSSLAYPIVVHCGDGGPTSGILVACCILIEQFIIFGYTNLPIVIRNLVRQRANLITTEKHYQCVFNVVKYFIRQYIKSPYPSQSLSHYSQPYGKF